MTVLLARAIKPALVLSAGLLVSAFLLQGQPAAAPVERARDPLAIRMVDVEPASVRLRVRSQGTVTPRTESELVAEVPGRVEHIESGLAPGAFFEAGEVLARLDPQDLALNVKRARAALERARAEEDFSSATLARQEVLLANGISSSAIVDEARRAARTSRARRLEAEADLERAERDLERTEIVAPFDGRTLSRSIGVGRFVSVGTPIARIYAVEDAEIRLPIPDDELAFLDLPIGREVAAEIAPEVILTTRFAGREHRWRGRIVRTEAQIDPRTRMIHAIARVDDPYASSEDPDRPPLAAGLFVDAEIQGRQVEGIVRLPRAALSEEDTVWVVDADDRLRRKRVEVLRFERDTALISRGLDPRDRVSLLEPRLASEGLAVRPFREDAIARSDDASEPTS